VSRSLSTMVMACAIATLPSTSKAQTLVSATAGASWTGLRSESTDSTGHEAPLATGGVRVTFFARPNLSIVTDARWVARQGYLFGGKFAVRSRADYLELSPRLALNTRRGPGVRGVFTAGPFLGLKTREVPNLGCSCWEPLASHELGGLATAGITNDAGRVVPVVELQYAFGISHIQHHRVSRSRSGTFSIVAGVGVRIGH
jgi:hypothetical protein